MYTLNRNIHLFLALLSLPFVLIYGISTLQMLHEEWFEWVQSDFQSRQVQIPVEHRDSPRAVAKYLMDKEGLRGDLRSVESSSTAVALVIARPGTYITTNYAPGAERIDVNVQVEGWIGMMNALHHVGGLWHDEWGINLWGVLVLVTSLALVGLGITGILLWLPRKKERLLGAVLLIGSTAVTVGLLALVRFG